VQSLSSNPSTAKNKQTNKQKNPKNPTPNNLVLNDNFSKEYQFASLIPNGEVYECL
jgi:hypothetical protein